MLFPRTLLQLLSRMTAILPPINSDIAATVRAVRWRCSATARTAGRRSRIGHDAPTFEPLHGRGDELRPDGHRRRPPPGDLPLRLREAVHYPAVRRHGLSLVDATSSPMHSRGRGRPHDHSHCSSYGRYILKRSAGITIVAYKGTC